ncbi:MULTISPECIES: sialidase family protein [Micromonospora]|uniref:Exo-alpha-sialidase n=1 Tax=Micromonospora solifontis TaxID=2487138 RepID=A0ABX9WI42_9ACTN|nr:MULTISPECIES: sialidase family protein [Micromonospora]NES16342.1 exo-alpha-sialidase [Micromonospora sp. PPF5-17B]NES36192.1 exo-alpha-sialidase [Micromonospora solifontis]NES57943.1 exo-alpha-sialidase [Micromonospora sp. PPF5-6]RNL99784.1 exo-alpha-sialidase [Micromonospora solifontis]
MPDREFAGFRVDAVAGAVRQPPLDELRVVARSRRRRSTALKGTALALLAMVIVVPLVTRPGPLRSAEPPTPSPGHTLPGRPGDFTLTGPESGVDVRIDGCVLRFAHTTDGGRTWSDWNASRYQVTRCRLDADGVAGNFDYAVLGQRTYLVDDGGLLHLSTDYGRTWQEANRAIIGVPAFPATARLVLCEFGCRAVEEPLAVDPASGQVYRLTGTPPSFLQLFSVYPAADGSIWTTYDTAGAAAGGRSTDRGATWLSWTLPPGSTVLALAAVDGRRAYRLVAAADATVTLESTTDGGRTWSERVEGFGKGLDWDLTIGADGSLLVVTQTGPQDNRRQEVRVSRDGGRSWEVVRDGGMPVGSVSVAPGYAWLFGGSDGPQGEADHLMITRDGRTWSQFFLDS